MRNLKEMKGQHRHFLHIDTNSSPGQVRDSHDILELIYEVERLRAVLEMAYVALGHGAVEKRAFAMVDIQKALDTCDETQNPACDTSRSITPEKP